MAPRTAIAIVAKRRLLITAAFHSRSSVVAQQLIRDTGVLAPCVICASHPAQ
jgi:hypothetical protein